MQNEKKPVKWREEKEAEQRVLDAEQPYIWLQDDQQIGAAACGCMIDYDHDGSARYWQCNLHKNAEILLLTIQHLCEAVEDLCLTVECEPKDSPNIMQAIRRAYRIADRARRPKE